MHEILDCMQDINLDTFEYCTLNEKVHYSSSAFTVYVPKLMADIVYGNKTAWNDGVNDVFINSTDCDINVSKTVRLQNYLTVPRFHDANFGSRADINGYLHPGAKFILQSMYGNPRDIHLERVL